MKFTKARKKLTLPFFMIIVAMCIMVQMIGLTIRVIHVHVFSYSEINTIIPDPVVEEKVSFLLLDLQVPLCSIRVSLTNFYNFFVFPHCPLLDCESRR